MRVFEDKMKRTRPCQHRRRLRSGKTITVNRGVKKRRTKPKASKSYGFFPRKKESAEEWLEVNDPAYKAYAKYNDPNNPNTYGKVTRVSGKAVGRGVAASGVIIPVVLPAPLTIAAGSAIANKVDNVKLIHTDAHDQPYTIPRVQINTKSKKKNFGSSFYHGTSEQSLAQMALSGGLQPRGGKLYLSDDPKYARFKGRQTGDPIIIEVDDPGDLVREGRHFVSKKTIPVRQFKKVHVGDL